MTKPSRLKRVLFSLLVVAAVSSLCLSQDPDNRPTGVIRLRVRVKMGASTKGLSRKRFFLVKGSLDQNRSWIQQLEKQTPTSRDCFYRTAGASEQFIQWLDKNDCESVYCRELRAQDVEGPEAVPEFQKAVEITAAEFNSSELGIKWFSTNLSPELRDGFYRNNQVQLRRFLEEATKVSGAPVRSVMTNRAGTAYFTDLEVGTYVLSNLLPTQTNNTYLTWNCELQVKPGDLSSEKPFLISNGNDRNVKCVAVEKPLSPCPTAEKQ